MANSDLQWQSQLQGILGGQTSFFGALSASFLATYAKAFRIKATGSAKGGAAGKVAEVKESVIGFEW